MDSNLELTALKIRSARSDDAPRLAKLSRQLGYPTTPEALRDRLQKIEREAEHEVCVAEAGSEVLGWIDLLVERALVSGNEVEIAGLVVDEACRGRGLGRRLMEHAEQWAREKGCRSVRLRSNVVRAEAHAFYERLGYSVFKTQKNFRKTL
jgi:ribosomal protein S18 acetylase RimI-like enzyme